MMMMTMMMIFSSFFLKKNLAKALLDRACVKWLHGDAIMYGPKR
jgi:hypothetical protein